MYHGIADEFAGIDLGDERLNRRAVQLLETLAANPAASTNAACAGWTDTVAAYRFFQNDRVDPEKILAPHRRATEARIDEHDVVLIDQDSTELDFSTHPAEDSRYLEAEHRKGLYDHSHVVFTPEGLCLGVVAVEFYDRALESLGKTKERRNNPIEEKESYRWLRGCELANEIAANHPNTHVISVADSEADVYDIFSRLFNERSPADFIIRNKQERCTPEPSSKEGENYKRVRDKVAESEVKVVRELLLPRTPKREGRLARLEIRAQTVVMKPPQARLALGEVECNVVLVEETGRSDDDETKVEWMLITTLPIRSCDDILRVVDYYIGRWPIEPYFRVYKTGCRVEDVQFLTTERRIRFLMFFKIIAWRILYVTHLGRECPDLPCDHVFLEEEWKPVWKIVTKKPIPSQAPTLAEFLLLVAELGGYNNRTYDLAPGPQSIWVGMRRMIDFAIAWQAFGPGP